MRKSNVSLISKDNKYQWEYRCNDNQYDHEKNVLERFSNLYWSKTTKWWYRNAPRFKRFEVSTISNFMLFKLKKKNSKLTSWMPTIPISTRRLSFKNFSRIHSPKAYILEYFSLCINPISSNLPESTRWCKGGKCAKEVNSICAFSNSLCWQI